MAAAYSSVFRELAFNDGDHITDEKAATLFQQAKCPPDQFHIFMDAIHAPALEQAKVPPHLIVLLKVALDNSWAVMPGCHDVATGRTGTRTGDVTADIIFSFVVWFRLKEVISRLAQQGLCLELPATAQGSMFRRAEGAADFFSPEAGLADDITLRFCSVHSPYLCSHLY